jgi:hypothetical protein
MEQETRENPSGKDCETYDEAVQTEDEANMT